MSDTIRDKTMYVINGETNQRVITRTLLSHSYADVVKRFKIQHPGVFCINADVLTEDTARTYGMLYNLVQTRIMIRRKDVKPKIPNPCSEIELPLKKETNMFESNQHVYNKDAPLLYQPTLVRGIDILKADQDTLLDLVRGLKAEIESIEDMKEMSKVFAKKTEELKVAILLVVARIDEMG